MNKLVVNLSYYVYLKYSIYIFTHIFYSILETISRHKDENFQDSTHTKQS